MAGFRSLEIVSICLNQRQENLLLENWIPEIKWSAIVLYFPIEQLGNSRKAGGDNDFLVCTDENGFFVPPNVGGNAEALLDSGFF